MSSYRKSEVTDAIRIEIASPLDINEMTSAQRVAWFQANEAADLLRVEFGRHRSTRLYRQPDEIEVAAHTLRDNIHNEISRTPATDALALVDIANPARLAELAELVADLASAVRPAVAARPWPATAEKEKHDQ